MRGSEILAVLRDRGDASQARRIRELRRCIGGKPGSLGSALSCACEQHVSFPTRRAGSARQVGARPAATLPRRRLGPAHLEPKVLQALRAAGRFLCVPDRGMRSAQRNDRDAADRGNPKIRSSQGGGAARGCRRSPEPGGVLSACIGSLSSARGGFGCRMVCSRTWRMRGPCHGPSSGRPRKINPTIGRAGRVAPLRGHWAITTTSRAKEDTTMASGSSTRAYASSRTCRTLNSSLTCTRPETFKPTPLLPILRSESSCMQHMPFSGSTFSSSAGQPWLSQRAPPPRGPTHSVREHGRP